MKNVITIVALAVDSRNLTMWKADGSTVTFPQGDHRVARIVNEAKLKGLAPGVSVEVDIAEEIPLRHEFTDAEKNTNGFVKFFKVAKAKLQEFFSDGTGEAPAALVEDIQLGTPSEQLVSKAMDTFLAVTANEPEVTVTHDERESAKQTLWITGYDKEHNRVGLVKVIRSVLNCELEAAMVTANDAWPIPLRAVREAEAAEFVKQLSQVEGVHFALVDKGDTPPMYVRPVVAQPTKQEKLAAVSEKLTALGALDSSKPEFHTEVKEEETIVAVVGDKVIPGAESLHRHLAQASKLKDYKGFTAFAERVAKVLDNRRHSMEDLMKFMEAAELPIADDGCILFLKRLNYMCDRNGKRVFVDVHSGNIEQWVGMKVQVKEELVDQSRRKDCSHGLHVAAMSYLSSFSGNVTIIGKVAPEDVFAVPEYSTNKMRVSAYHILAELPKEERGNVCNSYARKSLSSTDVGKQILADAIIGNHSSPTDLVTVGGHNGSNLKYSKLTVTQTEQVREHTSKEALNMELSTEDNKLTAEPVKATDLKPTVAVKPAKAPTVKEQILELVKEFQNATTPEDKLAAADLLVELRGKARKPWGAFGVDSSIIDAIAVTRASIALKPKAEPVKKVKPVRSAAATKTAPSGKHADNLRSILEDTSYSDYQKAHAMHDYKRAAKKSYAAMGLTEDECKAIAKMSHHLK